MNLIALSNFVFENVTDYKDTTQFVIAAYFKVTTVTTYFKVSTMAAYLKAST